MGVITDIIIPEDARKQSYLTSGISSYNQKNATASYRPDKFSRICFPAFVKHEKSTNFLGYKTLI
jgi:hypothetical protein